MRDLLAPLSAALIGGAVIASAAGACTNDFGQYNFGTGGGGGTGLVPGVGGMGASGGMGSTGGGGPGDCETNEDCGMDSVCRQWVCSVDKTCLVFNGSLGTACMQMGGANGFCDGVGNCVECINGTQCLSGVCDTFFNECVDPTCTDLVQNGMETDQDCGGGMCPPCMNGEMCNGPTDCASQFCSGGTCTACTGDGDCAAVADTYCDAGVCTPKKPAGDPCGGANECLSGFCPGDDSVCCDVACEGLCESCLAADTAQVNDGTCDAVTAGTDPKSECIDMPTTCQSDFCSGTAGSCQPSTMGTVCRASAGLCDVQEICDGTNLGCPADLKEPNTTVCRPVMGLCDVPEACDGVNDACPTDQVAPSTTICRLATDFCDAQELCDGLNPACPADQLVPDGGTSNGGSCSPYVCDGMVASCPTTCAADPDCSTGFTCNLGTSVCE
ncbi:MAG: hypothetical protein R3B72_32265 [Polyangiaceae bacterium]